MTARAMRSSFQSAGAAGLNAFCVSAAARTGITSSPFMRVRVLGMAPCPLPIPIKVEDADPASVGRNRTTNHGRPQQNAAAATGGSGSLDAPETPVGAQHDKIPKGPKRSSSKALGFSAERLSGNKRLKASGSSEPRGSPAGLPGAKASRRAEVTASKATSPMHPRAMEVEDVYGDPAFLD